MEMLLMQAIRNDFPTDKYLLEINAEYLIEFKISMINSLEMCYIFLLNWPEVGFYKWISYLTVHCFFHAVLDQKKNVQTIIYLSILNICENLISQVLPIGNL